MELGTIPERYDQTREALHQIAFFALGPARYQAEERMGLRASPGGFGTPPFEGKVARVEGGSLVFEQGGNIATQTITSVRAAAEFFGVDYQVDWYRDFHDPLQPMDPDQQLVVDDDAARAMGHWFEFGTQVLERLRSRGSPEDDISEIQLWPEHFDVATEMGSQEKGQRASYGASPGDPTHAAPYIYVAAWEEVDRSNPYWNSSSFNGASLGHDRLADSDDPLRVGLDFLIDGYRMLHVV